MIILLLDAGILGLWPAMDFPVLTVATLACTVICAAISFYALERPLMRWGRSRGISTPGAGRAPDSPVRA